MHTLELYKKAFKIMNAITVIATLLLILCFIFSFDANSGYLTSGPLTTSFFVVYGVGVIVSVASVFLSSEFDDLETPNELTQKSKLYYTIPAVTSILFGLLAFTLTASVEDSKMLLVSAIGLICFGVYCTLVIFFGYSFNIIKAAFLFFSIIFPTSIGIGNSRNYHHHINSIENVFTVLFAISYLIYVLYEVRRLCTGKHSEFHFPAMLVTYMSGTSLSVAYILAFTMDKVKEGYRFYQMIMIFAISIHMVFELNRLIASARSKSKYNKVELENQAKENE